MSPGRSLFCEFARARYLAYSLYHSIQDRDIRSVNFLLREKKANSNHVLWEFGFSPLHLAASLEDEKFGLEVLKSCLAHGGNPNVRSPGGSTPVHIAAAWKRMAVYNYLTRMGGDLNCIDEEGLTPLDYLRNQRGSSSSDESILSEDRSTALGKSALGLVLEDTESSSLDIFVTPATSFLDSCSVNLDIDLLNEAFIDENFPSFSLDDVVSDIENSVCFMKISSHNYRGVAKRFSSPLISPYRPPNIIGETSAAYLLSPEAYLSNDAEVSFGNCLVDFKSELANFGSRLPFVSRCSSESATYYDANEILSRRSDASLSSCPTEHLRLLLKQHNLNHGPIVKTTKRVYLYRLKKCANGLHEASTRPSFECNDVIIATLSGKLPNYIQKWFHLELEMINSFKDVAKLEPKLDPTKQYFTYLLLDPLISGGDKICDSENNLDTSWSNFLKSIFYVGKGKNARPLDHLMDAVKTSKAFPSAKIKKIKAIWTKGVGVVCIHVFHNISEAEALTREAAMITALNNARLTNVQRGRYYGGLQKWSLKKKRQLGVVLLYRSMMMMMAEGERQIFPSDFS